MSIQSGEEVGCVRIAGGSDGLPAAVSPRHAIIGQNQTTRLEITTRQTVNEPVLSLIVTVGCVAPITRDYILLLDPPEMTNLASTATDTSAQSNTVTSGPSQAGPGMSAQASTAIPAESRPKKVPAARNNRRTGSSSAAIAAPKSVPDSASAAAKLAQAKPRATAPPLVGKSSTQTAPSTDRLVLSSRTEGTALRLSTDLPPSGERTEPDARQLSQLRQQQEQMTLTLNGQDAFATLADREAALTARVQRLTEEATNLQKQIDGLTVRNQTLERSSLPAYLVWILGALVLAALGFVAWFVSRYRMLKMSASGKPWWTSANHESAESNAADSPEGRKKGDPNPVSSRPISEKTTLTGSAVGLSAKTKSRISSTMISTEPLMPLGNTTTSAITTDIGMLSRAANAIELTEHEAFPHANVDEKDKAGVKATNKFEAEKAHPSASPAKLPASNASEQQLAATDVKIDPEKIDFMLDIASSREAQLNKDLDFSIATVVNGPPPEQQAMQTATESFFGDMEVPRAGNQGMNSFTASEISNPAISLNNDEDPTSTVPLQVPLNLEQSSLHFRLVQFTSVIEQIEELRQKDDSVHAIALLRRYVLREEGVPILMWLMLLEEYRKTGKKAVYEALSEHFAKRYGRPMLKWDESLAARTPQLTLTQVPEIDENIKVLWGTQKGLELINQLISATDQSDAMIFNGVLQRELLQLAPMYPLENISGS